MTIAGTSCALNAFLDALAHLSLCLTMRLRPPSGLMAQSRRSIRGAVFASPAVLRGSDAACTVSTSSFACRGREMPPPVGRPDTGHAPSAMVGTSGSTGLRAAPRPTEQLPSAT